MPSAPADRTDRTRLDGRPWHSMLAEETTRCLGVHRAAGLSTDDARVRAAEYGPNALEERAGRGLRQILWEQVSSVMIVILMVAGVLALLFKSGDGPPLDAIAIFAIIVLFVVLGVLQEYRAQRAIAALRRMSSPTVKAVRDGRLKELSAHELVPGDVVRLETGSVVPADCRILESVNLRVQEAALTGESEPIEKVVGAFDRVDLPLGDRRNMGYMGTFVTYGRGEAVVVETGMRTELGKIATMIQSVEHEPTPLQKRLDRLGKTLAVIAVVVAAAVALIGLVVEGKTWAEVLIIAIAIAVAIVPEGLPAVQTFALAIGAQRMAKRKALIRKLPAVETLGSVTVICSDKTGTLTQNRMTVTALVTMEGRVDLDTEAGSYATPPQRPSLPALVGGAGLCSDATLSDDGETGVGDPTEVALVVAARRYGLGRASLEACLPRVAEVPFDSVRKLMTTVHRMPAVGELPAGVQCMEEGLDGHSFAVFTKGAADHLLGICHRVLENGRVRPLTESDRAAMHEANIALASQGVRVLGVGFRGLAAAPDDPAPETVERDLVFLGLVGMIDPPRPEAKAAVARCRTAGIRTIMITGDHPDTARSIAADLGMTTPAGRVVTGAELERMSDADLREALQDPDANCFARVSPEHKLRIVGALQRLGHVVAMTGDGVNDAPALKRADIGVAMGITGTDVAKEAADMVLLDDNFATIVAAVEEGRVVYDNLRRFIMFSISGNVAKVIVVAASPLIGLVAMLKPIQILLSNLFTDGLLGLGMGMEAPERNTMSRPPYAPGESVFSRGVGRHIAIIGPVIGLLLLALGYYQWQLLGLPNLLNIGDEAVRSQVASSPDVILWGTLMFTALALMQVGRALSSRSFIDPFWRQPLRTNKVLVGMILAVAMLQMLVVYLPGAQAFFSTTSLSALNLLLCVGFSVVVLVIMEALKALERRRRGGISGINDTFPLVQ
jgi:P-type Ca2+ transporter type 2C